MLYKWKEYLSSNQNYNNVFVLFFFDQNDEYERKKYNPLFELVRKE